jgi:hypothetical protein
MPAAACLTLETVAATWTGTLRGGHGMFQFLYLLSTDFPQLWRRVVLFVQWTFLVLYYSFLIGTFTTINRAGDLYTAFLTVAPTAVFIALALLAFQQDKRRDALGSDDFRDGWLFFRYGQQIDYVTIPIPVKEQWGFKETLISAETLRTNLAEKICARLPYETVQVIGRKVIADLETGEQKEFTRISIRSPFGSMVTMYLHYAAFGQTITAHYFTYRRGIYGFWALAKFALASPFTPWFWGIPWLRNRHSLISRISDFRSSSFDGIDLQTMYGVAHRVVYEETAAALREVGLLTEELQQIININIQSVRNLQSLAVINSPGAVMSGNEVSLEERSRVARSSLSAIG